MKKNAPLPPQLRIPGYTTDPKYSVAVASRIKSIKMKNKQTKTIRNYRSLKILQSTNHQIAVTQ